MTKVLIFGGTGMLGHTMHRVLAAAPGLAVSATARPAVDAGNPDDLARAFEATAPDVVINCVGLVKQLDEAKDRAVAEPINALLPHRLAALCSDGGARLVHFSTDCVFSGRKGDYSEDDLPDPIDVYGETKLEGEVAGPGLLTLRTSMIGPELRGHRGLLDWFLAKPGPVPGYARAIFSGLPTVELARIVRDHVIPNPALDGLYHVSADPISKLDLLRLFAAEYGHDIEIVPDGAEVIDRSLDSSRFRAATGYVPPAWPALVAEMRAFG